MSTNTMVDLCLGIALKAHAGQPDLDGNPVILHPLTVGLAGKTPEEQCTGFLHDVVEDTDYTFDDLLQMGVSADILDALRLLTHDPSEPYRLRAPHRRFSQRDSHCRQAQRPAPQPRARPPCWLPAPRRQTRISPRHLRRPRQIIPTVSLNTNDVTC